MERRAAFLLDNPLCAACRAEGRTAAALEVDHVVPLWKNGPDTWENLQALCLDCHAAKSAREAMERGA